MTTLNPIGYWHIKNNAVTWVYNEGLVPKQTFTKFGNIMVEHEFYIKYVMPRIAKVKCPDFITSTHGNIKYILIKNASSSPVNACHKITLPGHKDALDLFADEDVYIYPVSMAGCSSACNNTEIMAPVVNSPQALPTTSNKQRQTGSKKPVINNTTPGPTNAFAKINLDVPSRPNTVATGILAKCPGTGVPFEQKLAPVTLTVGMGLQSRASGTPVPRNSRPLGPGLELSVDGTLEPELTEE